MTAILTFLGVIFLGIVGIILFVWFVICFFGVILWLVAYLAMGAVGILIMLGLTIFFAVNHPESKDNVAPTPQMTPSPTSTPTRCIYECNK